MQKQRPKWFWVFLSAGLLLALLCAVSFFSLFRRDWRTDPTPIKNLLPALSSISSCRWYVEAANLPTGIGPTMHRLAGYARVDPQTIVALQRDYDLRPTSVDMASLPDLRSTDGWPPNGRAVESEPMQGANRRVYVKRFILWPDQGVVFFEILEE
jgi:hypothetical protein